MANEQIMEFRHKKIKNLLESKGLQHVLILNPGRELLDMWIFGTEKMPVLPPHNRNASYIVSADGEITKLIQVFHIPTDNGRGPMFDQLELSFAFHADRIGVVNPAYLKNHVRNLLLKDFPDCEMVDISKDFCAMKAEKCPEEVEQMRKAAMFYDRSYTAMHLMLRAERLEKEIVNEIRQRLAMMGAGGEKPAANTIVEFTSAPDNGPAVQEPLRWPGRRIMVGDRINVSQYGYLPSGFACALGRSYTIGAASEETKAYWGIAREAQNIAAQSAVPGATLREIAKKVNTYLTSKGFPADESAWIHGMGVHRFEVPRNTDESCDQMLKENMTLAIGPIVHPQGQDPMRCLDVFVVKAGGAERLSSTTQALRELH